MPAEGIERLGKRDEVARDQLGPLMDQLVERMLAIGARLSPEDRVRYANRIPTLTAVDRELFLWLYRIGPTRRSPAPCENSPPRHQHRPRAHRLRHIENKREIRRRSVLHVQLQVARQADAVP